MSLGLFIKILMIISILGLGLGYLSCPTFLDSSSRGQAKFSSICTITGAISLVVLIIIGVLFTGK
jgi:uncharacterized protein YacL